MRFVVVACLVLCLFGSAVKSQCLSNDHWWAGRLNTKVFIDFTTGTFPPPSTVSTLASTGVEATTSFTASDGTHWFSTDGVYVYDMRPGTPALLTSTGKGDTSTNVPAIFLSIGNGRVYLFTNNADLDTPFLGSVSEYILDSTVIPATLTLVTSSLISNTVEGSLIMPGPNAYTFWYCVFQKQNANLVYPDNVNLACVKFDPSGVLQSSSTVLPFQLINDGRSKGGLDYSYATNKVAITLATNTYQFDWDSTNGVITNPQFLFTASNVFYDIAYSPSGDILYYTNYGGSFYGRYQISTGQQQSSATTNCKGVELGPDGRIYFEIIFSTDMLVVTSPDTFGPIASSFTTVTFPGKSGAFNAPISAPCGLVTADCTVTCDDGIACTIDACIPGGGCAHTPTSACSGVGGDPIIYTLQGNHKLNFEQEKFYEFHNSTRRYRIVLQTNEYQLISAVGVNFYPNRFLAQLNNGAPEFYFDGELLKDGERVHTSFGVLECFIPGEIVEYGPLSELSRYITIAVKINNQLEIHGGLHPSLGGFFNIASRVLDHDNGLLAHLSGGQAVRSEQDLLEMYETWALF